MPNLVAIDISVADKRIRLAFSDRSVAAAYAAYLRAQDLRPPPHHHAIPGYQRLPQLHPSTREVSLALPEFITWFITCPADDEDTPTFTPTSPAHATHAARWAETMLLFERVVDVSDYYYQQQQQQQHIHNRSGGLLNGVLHHRPGSSHSLSLSHAQQQQQQQQYYVRRLWNRGGLLKRLEEMKRAVMVRVGSPWAVAAASGITPSGGIPNGGIPNGNGNGNGANPLGLNGTSYHPQGGYMYGGGGGYVSPVMNGAGSAGAARTPVALTVPGRRRGDIWW